VFSDDDKKYLSTELIKEEPVREDYLAPGIELLGLSVVQRVCALCARQTAVCHLDSAMFFIDGEPQGTAKPTLSWNVFDPVHSGRLD
jgi:hypothetical protein